MDGVLKHPVFERRDYFSKLPNEILMEIFNSLSYFDLMNVRILCPLWNDLAIDIMENHRSIVFTELFQLQLFEGLMNAPHQVVFGRIPRHNHFSLDVADIIKKTLHSHIENVVYNRFAAIKHGIENLQSHWGTNVKTWICNLQIGLPGVPANELCQELRMHLLQNFPNLEELNLDVPMLDVTEQVMPLQTPPTTTRASLRILQLNVGNYEGAHVPSNTYIHFLKNVMMTMLSVTHNLISLRITKGYSMPNFIIQPVMENAAQLAKTLDTLIITLPMTTDNLDVLTAARFLYLKKLEICLYPNDNEGRSISSFLHPLANNLTHLSLVFKRELAPMEPELSNSMREFPQRSLGAQFPRLVFLTLGGYIKGTVRIHAMPLLQSLCLEKSKNLKFTSVDFHSHQTDKRLCHQIEELEFAMYSHTTSGDHPILQLISPRLKILRLVATEFRMTDLLQKIFTECTMLKELAISDCYDLKLSDRVLCAGPRPTIPAKFVEMLLDDENGNLLKQKAIELFDNSSKEPGQIANLKDLRKIFIASSRHSRSRMPITDKTIFYGLSHLPMLKTVIFNFKSFLTWKAKLMMEVMVPDANIEEVEFRR